MKNYKKKSFFLLGLLSNIIDLSIVFTVSLILNIAVSKLIYIQTVLMFCLTGLVYFITFYLKWNKTIGNHLFSLRLIPKEEKINFRWAVIKREIVFKTGLCVLTPIFFIHLFKFSIPIIASVFIYTPIIVFSLIFWNIKRIKWWDYLSGTRFIREPKSSKSILKTYFLIFIFWIVSYSILRFENNSYQTESISVLGFNYPLKNKEYPNNTTIKKYKEFLSKKHFNINDYIFNLYKSYDIVIICERFHPEMTQWDMIFNLVSDERFCENIGNIFTEYGPINQQHIVDNYLFTKYENDSILDIQTGKVMNKISHDGSIWEKAPFFYFLKKLNLLNSTKPDSLKVKLYYTAPNLITEFATNIADFEKESTKSNLLYDSIMAYNVINTYENKIRNERRKKSLVITNYRHSFINHNNTSAKNFFNETQANIIYTKMPKIKVANVLINTFCATIYPFYYPPVQKGKWDKAFSLIGNKQIGFNFENSPFGNDFCDIHPGFDKSVKYKDVFTGMIFYKPLEQFIYQNGYPYMITGNEDDYAKYYKLNYGDTIGLSNSINNYKIMEKTPSDSIKLLVSFGNFIEILIFFIVIIIFLVISTFHITILLFKNKNHK